MNATKIAAAFRALAEAFEEGEDVARATPAEQAALTAAAAPAEPAKPRGRGRPPKAETAAAPATAPAPEAADPFAAVPAAATAPVQVVTLEEVRKALTDLKAATDQATAVGVLKSAGGADNLSSLDKLRYLNVVVAAKAAMPQAAVEEADPFETAAVEEQKAPSLEDVKAACVAAGKRTAQDKVQAIVMQHGGTVAIASGGTGPSLKAIPVSNYAAVIAAVNALPTTK